jgi:hypothetical protein
MGNGEQEFSGPGRNDGSGDGAVFVSGDLLFTVPCSPFPVPACPLAFSCAAIQVPMSSGGTSINRSAPCITSWNTGPDTEPP